MNKIPAVLITIASAAWSIHAEVDTSKLPPASTEKGVTYAKDIRPIFEATCFRCHGEERQKGDLRLDSLTAVLKGGEDGQVVLPGKSAESPLVIAVARLDEEKAMPPKPKPGQFRGGPGGRGPGPGGPPPGGEEKAHANPNGGPPGPGGPGGPGPGGRGGFQPPKPLTPEQVGLIRAWIDQGAK